MRKTLVIVDADAVAHVIVAEAVVAAIQVAVTVVAVDHAAQHDVVTVEAVPLLLIAPTEKTG